MPGQRLEIIYDGDCPFCSRYVRLVRIRENFDVELIDARTRPDLAADFRRSGYDLGDGMIALLNGRIHYGWEAVTLLSLLSSESGTWNRALALVFRQGRAAAFLYPFL